MVSDFVQRGPLLRPVGQHAPYEVLELRAEPSFCGGVGPGLFSIFMTFKYNQKDKITDQGLDTPH
jgi:hypothetical protein